MAPTVQILPVSDASDGTGAGPVGRSQAYRDDRFYTERIAEKWAKERGLPSTGKYRLDRLPTGFAGYACPREKQPEHVDRYLYGHPKGYFRSMNELYPHFVHLQTYGGSVGCDCKLCTGISKGAKKVKASSSNGNSNSVLSSSPGEQSRFFPATANQPPPKKRSSDDADELPQGRLPSISPSAKRRKHIDEEGTPDLYHQLVEELRDAGEQGVEKELAERISPDWRAGQDMLQGKLGEWSSLPSFAPRVGELVLFARDVSTDDSVAWDNHSQSLRRVDAQSKVWMERLKWEVGVVTQMPTEPISVTDLTQGPGGKSVIYSGFRVEPLSEPGNASKLWTKQHKYVPLHAIRPFSFWKELLAAVDEAEWHPTVKHALTVASSFSVIGRYSFKGIWPEAAIFSRGVYIGPELVMVGDTVRLLPQSPEINKLNTDVLMITSIRLRFVKLDQASEDYDGDGPRTYQTCLHFTGKPFTLDPQRSFGGIARAPVHPGQHDLPAGLAGYGRWFSMVDLKGGKARMEVPFSRILGRFNDHDAVRAWFQTPSDMPPPSSFKAVNSGTNTKIRVFEFSQGLVSTREARKYSIHNDARIDKQSGKTWFWADTRIEQLDLHEVNGRFAGPKNETRTKKQMHAWRQALKLLDGKKGGFETYQATLKQRRDEQQQLQQASTSAFGMMATGVQNNSSASEVDEGGKNDDEDMEDVEVEQDMNRAGATSAIGLLNDDDDVMHID